MQVRQCKDTFIRTYGDIGYITNQLTKHDRVYDDVGKIFLEFIDRTAKNVDDIVDKLYPLFADVSRETIYNDFFDFIYDLENESFLVTGHTGEEMNRKESTFSYSVQNPKTIAANFLQKNKNAVFADTADFFYEYFRENPTIFGIHIEVTSGCNEHCTHCYQIHDRKRDMELNLALDVLGQLDEMGTVSTTFSGGEPFLHPDFFEILSYARKKDFIINVLTNGYILDNNMIQVLKDVNPNMIQVSLYSMDPEKHDAVTRVKGSHKRTVSTIEALIASDIPVQISCPILKINKDSYKDVSMWCAQHKVRVLSDFILMARTNYDTSNLAYRLNLEETGKLIHEIIEVEDEYRDILELEPKSKDIEKYANQPVCGVGVDNACITADGSLYPCSGFQNYILGNAYEKNLKDIWHDSGKLKFLRSIKNSSFPKCMDCNARDFCAMCLVRNFNESNGDMFKINSHYCDVAKLNKRLVEEHLQKIGRD